MWNENKNDNQGNWWALNLDSLQNSGDFVSNETDSSIVWLSQTQSSQWSYVNLDIIDKDIKETNSVYENDKIILGDDWMKNADRTKLMVNRSYRKLFTLSFFGMIIFSLVYRFTFVPNEVTSNKY